MCRLNLYLLQGIMKTQKNESEENCVKGYEADFRNVPETAETEGLMHNDDMLRFAVQDGWRGWL